jgi:hypothetical protein
MLMPFILLSQLSLVPRQTDSCRINSGYTSRKLKVGGGEVVNASGMPSSNMLHVGCLPAVTLYHSYCQYSFVVQFTILSVSQTT